MAMAAEAVTAFQLVIQRSTQGLVARSTVDLQADGVLQAQTITVPGHKGPVHEHRLSPSEMDDFFTALLALGLHDWPANSDCCMCGDSTWSLAIDRGAMRKQWFGVCGLEPDSWPQLLQLIASSLGIQLAEL